jgi:hypothetical protein
MTLGTFGFFRGVIDPPFKDPEQKKEKLENFPFFPKGARDSHGAQVNISSRRRQ